MSNNVNIANDTAILAARASIKALEAVTKAAELARAARAAWSKVTTLPESSEEEFVWAEVAKLWNIAEKNSEKAERRLNEGTIPSIRSQRVLRIKALLENRKDSVS